MRKGFLEEKNGEFYVGCRDKESGYDGSTASVYMDADWLWIVTDEYEGCAMINIEALPHLRRALAKLAKRIKAQTPPNP